MVNTDAFTKRLNQIMEYYDLSAASFADKIDVGRSSISHLLSGRNKPSLDFVMKIINAFPEVELYWLLNGKGSFPKKSSEESQASVPKKPQVEIDNLFTSATPPVKQEEPTSSKPHREIKRIVVLYTDGTFEAYDS